MKPCELVSLNLQISLFTELLLYERAVCLLSEPQEWDICTPRTPQKCQMSIKEISPGDGMHLVGLNSVCQQILTNGLNSWNSALRPLAQGCNNSLLMFIFSILLAKRSWDSVNLVPIHKCNSSSSSSFSCQSFNLCIYLLWMHNGIMDLLHSCVHCPIDNTSVFRSIKDAKLRTTSREPL